MIKVAARSPTSAGYR